MRSTPHPSTVIGVVGAGYVGLVTTALLAKLGHRVVCLDVDSDRVAMLARGEVPVVEPGLGELLAAHAEQILFSTRAEDLYGAAGVVFVAVDTPPLPSGEADLSRVQSVIDAIPTRDRPLTLVMKSTVPVGTGARLQRCLRERGLSRVRYVSNPEFLREGSAIADATVPDRVVVGADSEQDAARVARIWAPLGGRTVLCDLASAEMVKLASNAFLATKISFINEIANVCDRVGADVTTVARGMGLDPRIGPAFLNAGIGYGGSCFPKDVSALKQLAGNIGYHFQLLSAVIEVNELQKRRLVTALRERLGTLEGRHIALLGIAFKPGTDDVREAPSGVLADRLRAEGASLMLHDPVVPRDRGAARPGERAATIDDALAGAHAAVIVTEWPEYAELLAPGRAASMANPLLLDGRNMLDPSAAAAAGYTWVGMGRPTSAPQVGWERAG